MRAVALALLIGLGGIENAIRGKTMLDEGAQMVYGIFACAFLLCLIIGK